MTAQQTADPSLARIPRAIPHVDDPSLVQMVTFRLHDALPGWTGHPPDPVRADSEVTKLWFRQFDGLLDRGLGTCLLADPQAAVSVRDALFHGEGERYDLHAWVIMPNHVHALVQLRPNWALSKVTHSWKSFTSNQINKLRGTHGALWQRDYFDRFMRNERHFNTAIQYIEMNPVKARLVEAPQLYRWSSAWQEEQNWEGRLPVDRNGRILRLGAGTSSPSHPGGTGCPGSHRQDVEAPVGWKPTLPVVGDVYPNSGSVSLGVRDVDGAAVTFGSIF